MRIEDRVKKYIVDNIGIADEDIIVMGVSGGADSMSLLFLLHSFGYDVRVVHVNHCIRGLDAEKDAEFIREYCNNAEIPCEVVVRDIPQIARNNHESLEEAGREVRYNEFEKLADSIEKEEAKKVYIAVGHHMNDQAETILHNLVRGTGIHGLTGMAPKQDRIIRPLLCLTRMEIDSFVKENKIPFVTDYTNNETRYTRNSIRHRIIPDMENINERAIEHISNTAKRLRQIDNYLEKISKELYSKYVTVNSGSFELSLEIFDKEERIIVEEVVRLIVKNCTGRLKDISSDHIGLIYEFHDKQTGKRLDLPYGLRIVKNYNDLQFIVDDNLNALSENEINTVLKVLEVTDSFDKASYPVETYTKWFDYDKIVDGALWRYRRSGDKISINGGSQKLQDFFTKQKIPQQKRDKILLLADGDEIIWVVGYRISEKYKVSDATTKILEAKIVE